MLKKIKTIDLEFWSLVIVILSFGQNLYFHFWFKDNIDPVTFLVIDITTFTALFFGIALLFYLKLSPSKTELTLGLLVLFTFLSSVVFSIHRFPYSSLLGLISNPIFVLFAIYLIWKRRNKPKKTPK